MRSQIEDVGKGRQFVLSSYATLQLLRVMKTLGTANGHLVNIGLLNLV